LRRHASLAKSQFLPDQRYCLRKFAVAGLQVVREPAASMEPTPMPQPIGDIALQIMWNRLIAVVEEQAQTLQFPRQRPL